MPDSTPNINTVGTVGTTPTISNPQQQQQQQQQTQRDADVARQEALQRSADKSAKNIFRRIQNQTIRKGSLISFQYSFYKHDLTPLCLVGKIWTGKYAGMISGLNLHYLTFRYIKYLVNAFCGKNFQYSMIRGDKYIVNAYRSYKREGRKQVKQIDCDFINQTLQKARSFKPGEVEKIRAEVQRQLKEKFHPRADDMAKEYQESIFKQGHKDYNMPKAQPDGRFNPTNVQLPGEGE